MTLTTLVLSVAITALAFTLIAGLGMRKVDNYLVSYLQFFTGVLFIFSGWVKAIDPLGTAYKMEQYFAEFESTFEGTWMSFLAPMFPALSEYSIGFSVFMIVLEIVLGVMLLVGFWRRFAAWTFFLIVAFFTFLTGFTYLTGYVPEGVNFFEFGKWGPYVSTNMKVTDCGCFGDFLKLEPKVSFIKDLVLLVPAILFLFTWKNMHQLFSPAARYSAVILSGIALTAYCFNNYAWNLPHTDFRPFKVGVNVGEQKNLEEEAVANVEITAYKLRNIETGEEQLLAYDEYLKQYKNFPKEEWEAEQIKTEPAIPTTKISDFSASDENGEDATEELLFAEGYSLMFVAYKLYGTEGSKLEVKTDTIYALDTIPSVDTLLVEKKIVDFKKRQVTVATYDWDDKYLGPWKAAAAPLMNKAAQDGHKAYAITAYADPDKITAFKQAIEVDAPFYVADDILLKTIVRSNPGLVLLKDGEIKAKFHHRNMPTYEELKANYMQD
ncbi:MAG: DoxX family protein [Bacteroidota bacterium]